MQIYRTVFTQLESTQKSHSKCLVAKSEALCEKAVR